MCSSIKLVTPEDVRGLLEDPVDRARVILIDCREEVERNSAGWITRSLSCPSRTFHSPSSFLSLARQLAGGTPEENPKGEEKSERIPRRFTLPFSSVTTEANEKEEKSNPHVARPAKKENLHHKKDEVEDDDDEGNHPPLMPLSSSVSDLGHSRSTLFSSPPCRYVVFYCHSSLSRGPRGARNFAKAQEEVGVVFPTVLLLSGGWSAFHMVYHHSHPNLLVYPGMVEASSSSVLISRSSL